VEDLNNAEKIKSAEWNKLKEIQRDERLNFFAEGKLEFSELRQSIYREIRDEFRERWADYYSAAKDGTDKPELASSKQALIAEQKAALEERRDEGCQALREARDDRYQALLENQREARHGLHSRQDAGFDSAPFLHLMEEGTMRAGRAEFQETASETAGVRAQTERLEEVSSFNPEESDRAGAKSGADIGVGFGLSLISFFDGLADGLIGGKAPPKPRVEPLRVDPFEDVIFAARERERAELLQADDEESRKKQRPYGE
jgi:hypothetical protein